MAQLYEYWGGLYGVADDGTWAIFDGVELGWLLEPPMVHAQKLRDMREHWPALSEAGPPLLAVLWRYAANNIWDLEPTGPWELVDFVTNGWAAEPGQVEATVPPPPVGRPKGFAPPPAEREAPSTGAGTGAGSDGGSRILLAFGALALGALVLYAAKRRS